MGEAILRNLSCLAMLVGTDGSTAMIAEDATILDFAAVALIVVYVAARIANGNYRSYFKSLLAGRMFTDDQAADRMFERQNISALKTCPCCTEKLPLSTLICEACDYNFLSGMVGHGHKLLPAPETRVHEMPTQIFAYRG